MLYSTLLQSIQSAPGLRLRLRLQPLYGPGELVFPSTYAGGGYLTSQRRIPGYPESVACAILDSVQSQANRMEDALAEDIRSGQLHLPHAVTDFSEVQGLEKSVGSLTSLEAPHRIFDAIIRDSELNGVRFPYTEAGKAVVAASTKDATALFRYDPTSLLFGSWDSTGVSGGLGEKYTRCVVSELVAINVEEAKRKGTRVDPLNIAAGAFLAVEKESPEKDPIYEILKAKAKAKKNPITASSGINHGSVPWPESGGEMHGGVSCDYIRQTTAISFPALRQLRFPVSGKSGTDAKAQAVLAAIALHAAALNAERGWHLRSRCDLVLDEGESVTWELLGGSATSLQLTSEETRRLLQEAIGEAQAVGLPWETAPLRLKSSQSLADLVRKSQQLHRKTAESSD